MTGESLFRAADVRWCCAQYLVIVSSSQVLGDEMDAVLSVLFVRRGAVGAPLWEV